MSYRSAVQKPANKRLLKRLGDLGNRNVIQAASQTELRCCILENLSRLFQIRQGGCSSAPQCGLPDFNELREGQVSKEHMCSLIKSLIEEFEPRLSQVRVVFKDIINDTALHFDISAIIVVEQGEYRFYAETRIKADTIIEIQ